MNNNNNNNNMDKSKVQQNIQKISLLQSQIYNIQNKLKLQQTKTINISQQYKKQLSTKDNKIKQQQQQLTKTQNIIKQLQQQIMTLKTTKIANLANFNIPQNTNTNNKDNRKNKIFQIKIQKTKQIPTTHLQSFSMGHYQQHDSDYNQLKEELQRKQNELNIANQRISKLMQKIVNYQKRIRQLQNSINQVQVYTNNKNKQDLNSNRSGRNNSKSKQRQKQLQINYRSDGTDQQQPQQQYHHPYKQPLPKSTIQTLILTKSYYKSPFLQIQTKNTIKLYKTDKLGKIDKSLGSLKYKLNYISNNIQQILTRILDKIYKNIQNNINNRIILYGTKRTNKKFMLYQIIGRLKKFILSRINGNGNRNNGNNSNINISEDNHQQYHNQYGYGYQGQNYGQQLQHQLQQNQNNMGIYYSQFESGYKKHNAQLIGQTKQQIIQILNNFQHNYHNNNKQQILKTPKKYEKQQLLSSNNQNIVRYFHININNLSIQIITSNFKDTQIRQNINQNQALDRLIYSKIPHFNYNIKTHLQIILTLNPIVGLYQACKQTLKIVNCKKKIQKNINIYDWRQSPSRNILLTNQKNYYGGSLQADYQIQTLKIAKAVQKVQFFKVKLNQLLVKIKVIINSHCQISYLKKSQTVLNYQKIAKFIQSMLNQGISQISSPNKKSVILQKLHDLDQST